jgi:protein-S-isoprenylcysteine O-methyltransferase Ste14
MFLLELFKGGLVVMQLNLLDFFGLRQIFQSSGCPAATTRTVGMDKLVTSGMFHYCRHPMYLFLLLSFILSPCVSLDKFLFVLYTILYLYIAIPIEERKLEIIFGQPYLAYQKRVPSVVPSIYRGKND